MKQLQFEMVAKTLFGLERVWENELKLLGTHQLSRVFEMCVLQVIRIYVQSKPLL